MFSWGCSKSYVEKSKFNPIDSSSSKIDTAEACKIQPNSLLNNIDFPGDSGYILKNDCISLLIKSNMTDSTNSWKDYLKTTDTLGKYYKSYLTNNILVCLLDLQSTFNFETHVLLELRPLSTTEYFILKKERYFHGNYSCCWMNNYEGFQKIDDFFTIKTCGTGSAYCSSYLYFFKTVKSQDSIAPIPYELYAGHEDEDTRMSSRFIIQDSAITFAYTTHYNKLDSNYRVIDTKTEKCTITYDFINSKVIPRDSTYIKKHAIY